jgi:hypothetical protein
MGGLTVLTDSDVKDVLSSLELYDAYALQKSLRHALHEYSTGTQAEDACSMHQPTRTVLQGAGGMTTLFMPGRSSAGIGMKGTPSLQPQSYAALTCFL